MNEGTKLSLSAREDLVMQDGVPCPANAPWRPQVSKWTGLPFIPVIVLAVYILVSTGTAKLVLWLILLGIFAYPLRYLVRARCPYYGQACSSGMGMIVPKWFTKQEGKSIKPDLWLDVVFFVLLFLIPLPEAWQLGGISMTLLWIAAYFLLLAVHTWLGCSACPFSFCPIGRAGKAFWSKMGK